VLGGVLLEHPEWSSWLTGNDWGSVFLINVPIVIVGAIGIVRVVPETRNPNPDRLDIPGLVLSMVGLTLIVFGIIRASDTNDWLAPSVVWPATAGLLIIAYWLFSEARSDHASFDVRLFRNRGFAVSIAAVSLTFFAMSGVLFTLPFYFQTVRGLSILEAGLCFLPFAAGQLLGAPRSSVMVARFGNRAVIGVGLVLVAVALLGLAELHEDTPLAYPLALFFVFGLGMGNVIAPASTVMQNVLPLDRVGAGSAVQNTVRQVFGAFGVAVIGTLLDNAYLERLRDELSAIPAHLPAAATQALGESVASVPRVTSAMQEAGAPAAVVGQVRDAAFTSFVSAANQVTWICLGVVVLAAVVVFALLPHVPASPEPAALSGSGDPGLPDAAGAATGH
jgi:MFS family permease